MAGNPNWKKGKSGNPSGRCKSLPGFIDKCREWADLYGFDKLKELAENNNDDKLQLAAVIYMLNRAYGKPTESVKLSGEIGTATPEWAKKALENPEVARQISALMGDITSQKRLTYGK